MGVADDDDLGAVVNIMQIGSLCLMHVFSLYVRVNYTAALLVPVSIRVTVFIF